MLNEITWKPYRFGSRLFTVSERGDVRDTNGRLKKGTRQKSGYLSYTFEDGRDHRSTIRAHVLVAELFISPRPKGLVVRHLNGDRTDNHFSNLAYGTHKENIDDFRLSGMIARGSSKAAHKITESGASALKRIGGLISVSVLAEWLEISPAIIGQCQRDETWRHVEPCATVEEALCIVFRHSIPPTKAVAAALYSCSGDEEAAELIIQAARLKAKQRASA